MSSLFIARLARAFDGRAVRRLLAASTLWLPWAAIAAGIGPTTREVVEFTRILQPLYHDSESLRSQVSPDGEHVFVVTRTADVASDKNRFDIVLLDVDPGRLASSAQRPPRRLLTVEARQDNDDAFPAIGDARWVDSGTLVFRARIEDGVMQAYRLDVATRRLTQLTHDPHGVVRFDISRDFKRVLYLGSVPNPAMPAGARSVVVGTNSFWSVHFGQDGFRNQQRRYRYVVVDTDAPNRMRTLGASFPESSGLWPSVSISPDGRWAVLPRYEPTRQIEWSAVYPQIAENTATFGPSLKLDPLSYYSRPYSYIPRRFVAYRLSDGEARVVLDAPDDTLPGGSQWRTDRLWQGGGTSVVIAGTFLPRQEGGADRAVASHVIEYWPESGKWKDIATLGTRLMSASSVPRAKDAFVVVDGAKRRRFDRNADGTWRESVDAGASPLRGGWDLRVDESLNRPPDIVAFASSGQSVRLSEFNPQFSAASWGTMRPFGWKDSKGRAWEGGLMVPAGFDPSVKHALVIQTYGFSPSRFYRDGSNLVDGFTSGFPGRAFLRENILVLALPHAASTGWPSDEHGAIGAFSDGVRGAIEAVVAEGAVDPGKIGIMGWSATGERVLNFLTFTDAPVRAATLLDGDANTLFSMTITYAVKDGIQLRKELTNEGGPFGASRERWIRNDPSLHTDCVRAALRIETYGPEVHNNWDIYALLRRQYRPVEMIVIPRGAHSLSRPSERMISLQGNVDWYRFWLQGEQRAAPVLVGESVSDLHDQYVRWNQMTPLKRAVDAAPSCDRTPIKE